MYDTDGLVKVIMILEEPSRRMTFSLRYRLAKLGRNGVHACKLNQLPWTSGIRRSSEPARGCQSFHQLPLTAQDRRGDEFKLIRNVSGMFGAGERNRTSNLRFTKPLLCRLSYASAPGKLTGWRD